MRSKNDCESSRRRSSRGSKEIACSWICGRSPPARTRSSRRFFSLSVFRDGPLEVDLTADLEQPPLHDGIRAIDGRTERGDGSQNRIRIERVEHVELKHQPSRARQLDLLREPQVELIDARQVSIRARRIVEDRKR